MERAAAIRPGAHALIATLVFCAAVFAYTSHMPEFKRFFSGINDFLPLYTLAESVHSGGMYDVEAGYRAQERAAGLHIIGRYHDRLPWQALLMAPLGALPYWLAYSIWIVCNLACFAGLVHFWLRPRDMVLWGAVFFPAAASIVVGQDGLMLTMCFAGVLILANRRRDIGAGILLALCTAKPHLFLLVPVALFAHRRWRLAVTAACTSIALLLVGTAVAGLDWVQRWLTVVRVLGSDGGADIARRPTVFQFGVNEWTIGAAILLAFVFGLAVWKSKSLEPAMAVAVTGSILIAPHGSVYDLPLLLIVLPALPLEGKVRWLRVALLTPAPYWLLLRGIPWGTLLILMLLAAAAGALWASRGPSLGRFASAVGE